MDRVVVLGIGGSALGARCVHEACAHGAQRSIKSECLNRMIFFGESSLRRAVAAYLEHYHTERAHQGLGNERIDGKAGSMVGEIRCQERVGGILKSYYRAA